MLKSICGCPLTSGVVEISYHLLSTDKGQALCWVLNACCLSTHKSPTGKGSTLLIYRWGRWISKSLPRVRRLVRGKGRIWNYCYLVPKNVLCPLPKDAFQKRQILSTAVFLFWISLSSLIEKVIYIKICVLFVTWGLDSEAKLLVWGVSVEQ